MDTHSPDRSGAFDRARHDQIARLLGEAGMRKAVRMLREDAAAFGRPGEERVQAHALASQCETLGFMSLGRACRAVEVAARAGRDFSMEVAAAREERAATLAAIDAWIDQEASISMAATAASDLLRTPSVLNRPAM